MRISGFGVCRSIMGRFRLESAEIFLVCLKYKAPTTIDPKFLDIQHVFEDVDEVEESALTFSKMIKKNK